MVSRRGEQFRLHMEHLIIATTDDSVLRTENDQPRVSGRGYPQVCPLVQTDELTGAHPTEITDHITEMSHNLVVSVSPFLMIVSVQKYRP